MLSNRHSVTGGIAIILTSALLIAYVVWPREHAELFSDTDVYFSANVMHQLGQVSTIADNAGHRLVDPKSRSIAVRASRSRTLRLAEDQAFFSWPYIRTRQYTMLDGSTLTDLNAAVICGDLSADQIDSLANSSDEDYNERFAQLLQQSDLLLVAAATAEIRLGSSLQATAFAKRINRDAHRELETLANSR